MIQQYNTKHQGKFDYHDEWYTPVEKITDLDDLVEAIKVKNILISCQQEYEVDSGHPCFWMLKQQETVIEEYLDAIGDFNKAILLKNINTLLKERGIKVGELEQMLGISTGYISRTSKPGSEKKLSVDVVWKVAQLFGKSLYELLEVDFSESSPTEKYIISFIEKLCTDTIADRLSWNRESCDSLNTIETDMNGNPMHPLFSYETFYRDRENGIPEKVKDVVFVSRSFDCNTYINGDCFNLRLKNGTILYVMDICKNAHMFNDSEAYAKELWMYMPQAGISFLCGNKDSSAISNLVDRLYAVLKERMQHPQIKQDFKNVIDAFMNNDFCDDYEDFPF